MAANPDEEGSETPWAMTEFGAALWGDARRRARRVRVAETLGARPRARLPDACADRAQLKAAARFVADAAVAPAALLAPHAEATIARLGVGRWCSPSRTRRRGSSGSIRRPGGWAR